jgi:hypothetical protein
MKSEDEKPDDEGWQYGDVWKQGTPETSAEEEVEFVDIWRTDTGKGFTDSTMVDLVLFLGANGITATFDAAAAASEFGSALKTYVLKVEIGKEEEAIKLLKESGKV